MNKTFFNLSTALGLLMFSLPVLAMESPENNEKWGHPCSSIAVRGEIKRDLKNNIYQSFEESFNNINGNGNKNSLIFKWNGQKLENNKYRHQTDNKVFFQYKPSDSYHVSLCIVLPPEGESKLDVDHQGALKKMSIFHLKPTLMIDNVNDTGHFYNFLTMVHSFDSKGKQINKTYKNQFGDLSTDFPSGISHLHFGLRYGTYGMVKEIVEDHLIPEINSAKSLFKNKYEGIFDEFKGHVTLAKMQKGEGKQEITSSSKRFQPHEYSIIENVYTKLKEAFDKDISKFNDGGAVPFERISMQGHVYENGKCTEDVLVKYDISK